jgi:Ca2+-transporting ATPase
MVIAQLVHAFNCRSERLSLFQVGLWTNRPLLLAFSLSLGIQGAILTIPAAAPVFKIAPLPIEAWVLTGAMGFLPFLLMELMKALRRQRGCLGRSGAGG